MPTFNYCVYVVESMNIAWPLMAISSLKFKFQNCSSSKIHWRSYCLIFYFVEFSDLQWWIEDQTTPSRVMIIELPSRYTNVFCHGPPVGCTRNLNESPERGTEWPDSDKYHHLWWFLKGQSDFWKSEITIKLWWFSRKISQNYKLN